MSGYDIAELKRAVDNLVQVGVIAELNEDEATATVVIGPLTTGYLPFMSRRAGPDRSWWAPETGEQVLVIAPGGVMELAIILPGGLYSDAHPAPADMASVARMTFGDGAIIEYDRAAHRLSATLPAGGDVDITAPDGVTINGDLVVTGDVHAGGAGGVSLLHHKHTDVQSGGSLTGKPAN